MNVTWWSLVDVGKTLYLEGVSHYLRREKELWKLFSGTSRSITQAFLQQMPHIKHGPRTIPGAENKSMNRAESPLAGSPRWGESQ